MIKWHDIRQLTIRGQAWPTESHAYNRLPDRAQAMVRPVVWRLSEQAAGLYVDFQSDAGELHARTMLRAPGEPQFHYAKYLDLYAADEKQQWRWAASNGHGFVPSGETPLLTGVPTAHRRFRLYLPSFFAVEQVQLGVDSNCYLQPLPPASPLPRIAYYGTSIIHASSAVRPGVSVGAILGRRLPAEMFNLGFSGSAIMEPELASLFSELDLDLLIVDPLPNMNRQRIEENAEVFLRRIIAAQPQLPILLVEDRVHSHHWLMPAAQAERASKRAAFHAIYQQLKAEGAKLYYHRGDNLLGSDSEGTVDGSHPSEMGFFRMADDLEPVIRSIVVSR